jgi:hypothetical protein
LPHSNTLLECGEEIAAFEPSPAATATCLPKPAGRGRLPTVQKSGNELPHSKKGRRFIAAFSPFPAAAAARFPKPAGRGRLHASFKSPIRGPVELGLP